MNNAERIIAWVILIPCLKVLTYGDISNCVYGHRRAGQAVGAVIRANENDPDVPWWRVVNNEFRPAPARRDEATKLLKAEGYKFCGDTVHEMHRWQREDMPNALPIA